ncbi:MAG: helix-turn-helix domain-containing protein [Gammaproteobacteria bacterium]|nr:helix-turn-helix domain-containing protein [Gammaproteobacteria bacterium]
MPSRPEKLNRKQCERARRARDARFDGRFFTAVKTTGIYCRPICPANQPLEKNVDYYASAISAAQAGYRPCLRCRPDSAPDSCAWLGTQTTFQRALRLIQQGELQQGSLSELAERLGISDRYLRNLFHENLGTSPKQYAVYQQCLFAKQLLHETSLPVTEIAFASGFNSVRRFNEAMQQQMHLSPSRIRKSDVPTTSSLRLKLYYRPPYAWQEMLEFLARRLVPGLEWVSEDGYGRTLQLGDTVGWMQLSQASGEHHLWLELQLNRHENLNVITQRIKALFDVDAPIDAIDEQLQALLGESLAYLPGLRVPGIWSHFEAGVRAILGQQVSVAAARNLVQSLVTELGEEIPLPGGAAGFLFPSPDAVLDSDLGFFKMPQARKDTVHRLARHLLESEAPDNIDAWSDIKGIGPWTVAYVKMRAVKDPDVWLSGDAGIRNALQLVEPALNADAASPWRSYLTFQLWNQL